MIDPTVTNNKGVENAEKNLEQAKHRLATEKKANDARRRIENRHKYMIALSKYMSLKQEVLMGEKIFIC